MLGMEQRQDSMSLQPWVEGPHVDLSRISESASRVRLAPEELIEDALATSSRSYSDEDHVEALSERYESLDYEVIENSLYKDEEKQHGYHQILLRQSVNRWVVCCLIGILTALVACFIDVLVYYTSKAKFESLRRLFDWCRVSESRYSLNLVLLSWWGFNLVFVSIACSLVVFFAGQVASGSGIPQIKCFLNGVQIPGVVRLKTLCAKALGVACSVAGGLSVGKEGPMIHSGAVVAAGISQGRCITFPVDFKVFQYFRSDHEKRDFVSAGAAAGVAAAFGAPIGGVLFSLEEGASFWNQSLTWRIFFASMVSSFTLSVVLSAFHGRPGKLSWGGLANFGTFDALSYEIWEIGCFLLMGIFGGLSGALFNHINYRLSIFRLNFFKTPWQRFLEALLVALVSGTAAFMMIFLIDDCQPLAINRNNTADPIQLWCGDGEYSTVAEIFFRSPEEAVKSLFHSPPDSYRPMTLGVLACVYFLLSTWTYGLSVPSGLFIPTLLTGAAWGRLVGYGLRYMLPEYEGMDPGKYALAGAAAQLGGVVRMTISLCAIIIEATHNITFGLPIMLILMMAKWVGDYFNEGLYDIHIHLAEVPLLGWHPPKLSSNIPASSVMKPNVTVVCDRERVGRMYDILMRSQHHGYPVVDRFDPDLLPSPVAGSPREYGRLRGLITRSQIVTLLQHRLFTKDKEGQTRAEGARMVRLADFRDAYPRYNVPLRLIQLTEEDRDCWLHLGPFLNPAPHRVPEDASLTIVFQLFRGLGLRNLIVVDSDNRVRGMVTRKDLARFREVRRRQRFLVHELYIAE